jgi:hypothetical protein
MPLFETAASARYAEAEALVNIAPGLFNNLAVNDVVFVAFEENAIEKPIIIGKLFLGGDTEGNIRGGGAVVDTLKVRSDAAIPASTVFVFPASTQNTYKDLDTPKKVADYIKRLEKSIDGRTDTLDENFQCFKNWTQWQLQAENVEIDDGDLDLEQIAPKPFLYQKEGEECNICGPDCIKNKKRTYAKIQTEDTKDKKFRWFNIGGF